MLAPPIDFARWIAEHRELLKPPVGNKCVYNGDFIVMVVGGPNQRTDYHWDEGPEFFHQIEGEMVLRVQEDGRARDIPIKAGEVFYLPPRIPHSPQRMPGSEGIQPLPAVDFVAATTRAESSDSARRFATPCGEGSLSRPSVG